MKEHTGGGNRRGKRRTFGSVRKLTSGRFQARYTAPDGQTVTGPVTFDTKTDADTWLAVQHAAIIQDTWTPPKKRRRRRRATLNDVIEKWNTERADPTSELAVRGSTHDQSVRNISNHITPQLGDKLVAEITPDTIKEFLSHLKATVNPPTVHIVMLLLKQLLNHAITLDEISTNPAAQFKTRQPPAKHKPETLTAQQVEQAAQAMPPRYALMVLLAGYCALRSGETAALSRENIDLEEQVIHVTRTISHTSNGAVLAPPKTEASNRVVAIPPHLIPVIREHLATHTAAHPAALVFEGYKQQPISKTTLGQHWRAARESIGKPKARFHDLRHTAATLTAQQGATVKELQVKLGHTTPQMAMHYQDATRERQREVAEKLSQLHQD